MTTPVVLVHGLASNFEHNWRELGWADLLAEAGREVVAVDLPGHGSAPASHDPADYLDLAGQVAPTLPPGPLDGIGFSLGARVLLELAMAEPERFGRLVLGGVGANLFTTHDTSALADALEGHDVGAPGVAGLFVRFADGSGTDPLALAALLRAPSPPMDPARLAGVSCPVLVVLGDRDFVGSADELVTALPDARLVTLRGVDHFGTPKAFGFLDAALDFLGAVPV